MGVHHATRSLGEPFPAALSNGLDDEPVTIGPNLQLGLTIDVEELEDRLLDDEPEAVSDGGELPTLLQMYNRRG